jgi:hypothetical protein
MNAKAVLTIIKAEADKLKHLTDAQGVLTYLAELEGQEATIKARAEKTVAEAAKVEAEAESRMGQAKQKLEVAMGQGQQILDKAKKDGELHLASIVEQGKHQRADSQHAFDALVEELKTKRAQKTALDAELLAINREVAAAKAELAGVRKVVADKDRVLGRTSEARA